MLDLRSPVTFEALSHNLVMGSHHRHRTGIAQSLGQTRRLHNVGEQDGAERHFDVRLPGRMLEDATHEAGYRGLVDLDDLIRHVAVRCAMNLLDRIGTGAFARQNAVWRTSSNQ